MLDSFLLQLAISNKQTLYGQQLNGRFDCNMGSHMIAIGLYITWLRVTYYTMSHGFHHQPYKFLPPSSPHVP